MNYRIAVIAVIALLWVSALCVAAPVAAASVDDVGKSAGKAQVDAKRAAIAKSIGDPELLSGAWYNPQQSGHGFSINVSGDTVAAAWYVFRNGQPVWLIGAGVLDQNTNSVTMQMVRPVGGEFPPNFASPQVTNIPWGTLTFVIQNCQSIAASWQPVEAGFTPGSLQIQPVIQVSGNCGLIAIVTPNDDAGNSCQSARVLALGPSGVAQTGQFALQDDTDADFFAIDVPAAGTLNFRTTTVANSAIDPVGIFYDAACAPIDFDDDSESDFNFEFNRAVTPGRYFVRVVGFGKTVGAYGVTYTFTAGP